LDFDAGEIIVRGDTTTGTKNWELRRIPLIPEARALFERMRRERAGEPLDAKLFRVGECQKISRSSSKKRWALIASLIMICGTFFATRCIESGVDVPTVHAGLDIKMAAHY